MNATDNTITVLKSLADDTRLAMVRVLADGHERCVCVLAGALGVSSALVSHHIKQLSAAGLVRTRRQGRWLYVTIDTDTLNEISATLAGLGDCGEILPLPPCCSALPEVTDD